MYCVVLLIIARFGALQYENDSLSHYLVVGIQRAGGYLRSRHLPHREAQLGRIDRLLTLTLSRGEIATRCVAAARLNLLLLR